MRPDHRVDTLLFSLERDNARLRALLAEVVKYWEIKDPNRGAAFESVIKKVKFELER